MKLKTRINARTIASRLDIFQQRHRHLDNLVEEEEKKPAPDRLSLQMLKRERLRLKDLLRRYEGLKRTLSRSGVLT